MSPPTLDFHTAVSAGYTNGHQGNTEKNDIMLCEIINDYVLGYKIPELVKHEKIMGCAFDASGYAIYQVHVSDSVLLFALRHIYPSRHVAEKGSYAEPVVLWDSNVQKTLLTAVQDG
jgi:hypothetical protein